MQDLIKQIFASIPKYISNFVQVLSRPRTFVNARDLDHENALAEALSFTGISLSLTMILFTPLLSEKTDFWKFFGIWILSNLILIIVSTAVLRLSWKIVGGQAPFDKLLKAFSYHFGVALPLGLLAILCSDGVIKVFNRPLYEQLMAHQLNEAEVTIVPLQSKAFIAACIIFFVGNILVTVWWIVGWGAYRILNQASRRQSLIAFALATVLSVPAMTLWYFAVAAVTK